jgi:hypothetical protein
VTAPATVVNEKTLSRFNRWQHLQQWSTKRPWADSTGDSTGNRGQRKDLEPFEQVTAPAAIVNEKTLSRFNRWQHRQQWSTKRPWAVSTGDSTGSSGQRKELEPFQQVTAPATVVNEKTLSRFNRWQHRQLWSTEGGGVVVVIVSLRVRTLTFSVWTVYPFGYINLIYCTSATFILPTRYLIWIPLHQIPFCLFHFTSSMSS